MSTEAPHLGQAAAAGKPTTGRNTAETIAAPIEINTVVASGSSPRLIVAFHPAWHAAANSTAAKTNGSIARAILGVCGRPPAPMGVVEHGARERHHIGLALGDDRLGLLGRGDQADRARRNAGLAFDP